MLIWMIREGGVREKGSWYFGFHAHSEYYGIRPREERGNGKRCAS